MEIRAAESSSSGAAMSQEVEATASLLANERRDTTAEIRRVYQLPAEDEARLVYVDSTVAPIRKDERIAPFYFAADPDAGRQTRSAIALIAPEDADRAALPDGWGPWEDARLIWERR